MKNLGGQLYRKELVSIADGKARVVTRALAIRALGLVRNADLLEPLNRWLKDPEPVVRASATLLLVDFPDDGARASSTATSMPLKMATSPAPPSHATSTRSISSAA